MKFRNDFFLLKCMILMVLVLIVATLSGCAPMTEKYWQDRYASMTAEEISALQMGGEFVTVCDLTDCIIVWVY